MLSRAASLKSFLISTFEMGLAGAALLVFAPSGQVIDALGWV
jgi:hypothetical protein